MSGHPEKGLRFPTVYGSGKGNLKMSAKVMGGKKGSYFKPTSDGNIKQTVKRTAS